jgi:hypothetical protein
MHEAELVEELSQHLRDRYDEMLAGGTDPKAAYESLLQELNDGALVSGLKASLQAARPPAPLGKDENAGILAGIWNDLRFGARLLKKNPGFAIVAILSLALGIGANTTIFQLLDAVRMRTLPVKDPQRLARVKIVDSPHCCHGDFYSPDADLTGALWNNLREQQQGFSRIAAWAPARRTFVSFTQANGPQEDSQLMIRSDEPLASLISSIKHTANDINPSLVLTFSVLKTQIREGLLREQLMATLSGFFGALATILAMVGLYGVISYMVVRRRNEIGVRIALGASRNDILVMVVREAAILLGIGLVTGTALALAAGTAAASMPYGLKPRDPLTLGAAITGMIIVALLASMLPAQRAATVHPMEALRED